MNDEERQAYYDRKVRKADDTAWLLMKITFYMMLLGIGYGFGVWVGEILDMIWG